MSVIGKKTWSIAEGYLPSWSTGPEPQMQSHETICILNTNEEDAFVEIMIFFSDRDPAGPYKVVIPACRTRHLKFNDFREPEPIPEGKDFASVISSDVPVVVQHTRLDSRQAENAIMTTIPFGQ